MDFEVSNQLWQNSIAFNFENEVIAEQSVFIILQLIITSSSF